MENQSSITKYFILRALRVKDMHGYDLITELEKLTGKKPSASQIYPVLKKMHSSGYVTVSIKNSGKKKIKSYRITPDGNKLFSEITKRFDAIIRSSLQDKIKICAHCDCEMIKGAVQKKMGGKTIYFCCESCAGSFKH